MASGGRWAPNTLLRLDGRFAAHPSMPACLRFAWGHSAVVMRFVGPAPEPLIAKSDAEPTAVAFDVWLDGHYQGVRTAVAGADVELAEGRPWLTPLAAGLAPPTPAGLEADGDAGTHVLALVRRNEALVGETRLCGVRLSAAAGLRPPPPPPAHHLVFVGDSITAGYGNEGRGPHCPFDPAQEHGGLAFGPLAASSLGAGAEVLAWSGRGLWRNLDGSALDTVPTLVGRSLPAERHATWDFRGPAADAVVINLGTNDYSGRPVDAAAFTAAYRRLLADLRAHYPGAHLVAALGPMMQDGEPTPGALGQARAAIRAAVGEGTAAGDVSFLEFPAQDGALGLGCDYHPSVATHRRMAATLVAHLRAHVPSLAAVTGAPARR